MRSGIRPNSFWSGPIRERVASQLARVRHWEVVEGSYEEAPVGAEACWFIDPPYQYTGRYYRHSEIDYAHLAMWVRGLRGQVIVCENEGADWLPFRPFRACKATHGKHRTGRSAEVIYYRDQETKKGP
jgi:16S rRNA G966 N2-methylase RsmD